MRIATCVRSSGSRARQRRYRPSGELLDGWGAGRGLAAHPRQEGRQGRGRHDAQAGNERGLLRVREGHHDVPETRRSSRDRGGQDAAHRAQPAVKAKLTQEHHAGQGGSLHGTRGREDGNRDGQIEAAAALRQAGRGQADRDPALRPLLAAVDNRRADPVAGLAERGVGQAYQDHAD